MDKELKKLIRKETERDEEIDRLIWKCSRKDYPNHYDKEVN